MAERDPDRPPPQRAPDSAAAFLGQLLAPTYVLDMHPSATAGRVTRETRHPPGREPAPGVLLVSRARDGEFDTVADLLGRVGVRAVRINADELDDADLLVDPARRVARVNGRWLRPTVTWLRHFSTQAIEGNGDRTHDLFLRESWGTTVDQLADVSPTSIRSHRPGVLAQLQLAERHGIAVPRTVLTTDPSQAKELLPGSKLVIKAAHQHFVEPAPGCLTGVFPAIVARGDLAPPPRPGPPVIVQEFVDHDAEFRVHYVAGQVHGFQIVKDAPADLWLHSDRVQARAVDLDQKVVRATRLLASALSLRYCAVDFLVRDGMPIFLEVNPDGDWHWIESKAGVAPVTAAVTRMLCDVHRSNLRAVMGRKGAREAAFDLLAFLTG
jgi:hypothetical protein